MDGQSTSTRPAVVIDDTREATDLLAQVGVTLDQHQACEHAFALVERDGRLDLRPPGEGHRPGIQAKFPPDRIAGKGTRTPVARAFGSRTDPIFDLTAGLGGDAYRLARAGHRVFASERDPVVFALLATGWKRDCEAGRVEADIAERLTFTQEDGAQVLSRIDAWNVGVYLDPMYPSPRRVRSLPKRELQVLRRLLGDEENASALLEPARAVAARVVVKRPHRASPLLADVSFEVSTKLVRFDVYVNPARIRSEPRAVNGRE